MSQSAEKEGLSGQGCGVACVLSSLLPYVSLSSPSQSVQSSSRRDSANPWPPKCPALWLTERLSLRDLRHKGRTSHLCFWMSVTESKRCFR